MKEQFNPSDWVEFAADMALEGELSKLLNKKKKGRRGREGGKGRQKEKEE